MPFIEESDLLDLHKDIDKAQIINERLLDQIQFKNKALKKFKLQRNICFGIIGLFLTIVLARVSYNAALISSNDKHDNHLLVSIDSLDAIKNRIYNLKQQNQELSLVKEFYLAKRFLEKQKVYSVQIQSLVENNITLTSEAITNTLFVKNNPFYSYSLGTFESLEKAQEFRKYLVSMGFEDAFVASYQDGKRLQIESPE